MAEYKLSYTGAEVNAKLSQIDNLAKKNDIPTKTSQLTNDSDFITGYTETDPTVPSWAKASTKPTYTKSEIGLSNVDNVKQYSANNPPPYPVTKVNNKTGAVSLTASDVWADASGTASNLVSQHNTATDSHSDIRATLTKLSNEKLATSELDSAIDTALAEAKASGEFDGEDGESGVYVGSGTAPTGTKVQVDPNGEAIEILTEKDIVQEAGTSESLVMSQKAVTDLVADALGTVGGSIEQKVNGTGINNIVKMTQEEYDAMDSHDSATLYVIEG